MVLVKWKLRTPNISEAEICKQEWHYFGWYLKTKTRGIFWGNSKNLVKVCWVPSHAIFKRACGTYLLKRKQEKKPNSNDLTSILFICQLQSLWTTVFRVRLRPTEAVLVFATVWNSLNERRYLTHLATDHPTSVMTRRAQKNWWWDDQSGKLSTGRHVESFPFALSFSLTLRCIFQICSTKLEQHCLTTELTKMRNHSSFLFLGYASVFKGRAKTIGLKTIGPHVSPNYATKRIHWK